MNTVMMVFTTFCLVLITWVLWAFKMGFGTPLSARSSAIQGPSSDMRPSRARRASRC